jgi:uncharacterized lipoprotein YehR (DUF1307 family)
MRGEDKNMLRWIAFSTLVLAVTACGTSDSNKIQGNQSGGIVPTTIKNEPDQIAAANAFCAQYNKTARVTAAQAEASGRLIFVCENAAPASPSVIYSTPQKNK